MDKILAIARNTCIEGVRAKTLYVLTLYALLILFAATALTPLALGEQGRLLRDLGLAGIELVGVLIAVVVGTTLVFREEEQRTIYVIIAKPVARHQFLAGKFIGMELLLLAATLIMTAMFLLGLMAMEHRVPPPLLLLPVVMIFLKISLVNAVALFFSSVASPILGAAFTCCLYLAGTLSSAILELIGRVGAAPLRAVLTVVYYLIPNLSGLDIKNQAVFDAPVDPSQVVWALAYTTAYTLALLSITALAYERKEFK